MPTVKMPRADWEFLLMMLEESRGGYIIDRLTKDIEDQIYGQEY